MNGFRRLFLFAALTLGVLHALALERVARTPYVGAIVTDAATGRVLFEDNADARGYPASVTKLMTFAIVMDRIAAGQLTLESPVTVSAEAAKIGGSQVFLKQGEVFTVDELLTALLVPSANDAAMALAIQVGGSRAAFVELMNAKARALGMTATVFHSPHGLPPGAGQQPDVSTARDLALLARELARQQTVLRYSAVKVRMLREKSAASFEMRNHNNLLGKLAGCDGLKTGYFYAAGSSIAVTAERGGRRVIAVVLSSEGSKNRDLKAMELVERGFAALGGVVGGALRPDLTGTGIQSGHKAPPTAETISVVRPDPTRPPMEEASTPAVPAIKFTPPAAPKSK